MTEDKFVSVVSCDEDGMWSSRWWRIPAGNDEEVEGFLNRFGPSISKAEVVELTNNLPNRPKERAS